MSIYLYTFKINRTDVKSSRYEAFHMNTRIVEILESMKYISNYNNNLYIKLIDTIRDILTAYYRFINDLNGVDDISFHKEKLAAIYEEIALNVPYKYYQRLNDHVDDLNTELDYKMDLIKYKSSKIPIKISLMNYKPS